MEQLYKMQIPGTAPLTVKIIADDLGTERVGVQVHMPDTQQHGRHIVVGRDKLTPLPYHIDYAFNAEKNL